MDLVLLAVLVLASATLVTAHVAIAARLVLSSRPRWRGLAVLVLPPLAPIWAYREGWRRSSAVWAAALLAYVVARVAAEV